MSTDATTMPALTVLSDDERMFRDAVREFAQAEIAPRAARDGPQRPLRRMGSCRSCSRWG